ncbi:MAG: ligase-associated DNA damage response exonuclease [Methyloceanibacter sp.]
MTQLLKLTSRGLYCDAGDFYIDPWAPVERAVVTHAHSDHARSGHKKYLAAKEGEHIFRLRLGGEPEFDFVEFGERRHLNGVTLSLHPAGHMTGSAQVRIERRGEVCVVSGDYKLQSDPTTRMFEPIRCETFVTESTFGLPIFQWQPSDSVFGEINAWWSANKAVGKPTVLYGYSVGKAQRLLASVDPDIGPIFGHGAIINACAAYRACGVSLPEVRSVQSAASKYNLRGALVVAPPSAHGTPWIRRFDNAATGMASGWMRVRGIRRRRAMDRGFTISDHVDWLGMLDTIRATEAGRVWVTHGYTSQVVDYLRQLGYDAKELITQFRGEVVDDADASDHAVTIAK